MATANSSATTGSVLVNSCPTRQNVVSPNNSDSCGRVANRANAGLRSFLWTRSTLDHGVVGASGIMSSMHADAKQSLTEARLRSANLRRTIRGLRLLDSAADYGTLYTAAPA